MAVSFKSPEVYKLYLEMMMQFVKPMKNSPEFLAKGAAEWPKVFDLHKKKDDQ